MRQQMYLFAWRWEEDGERLEGRFLRIEKAVTAPRSGKAAAILVLEVEGRERSLWLSRVALKRFAAHLVRGGISPSDRVRIEHLGTRMLDEAQGRYRRDYRVSVNEEVVAA